MSPLKDGNLNQSYGEHGKCRKNTYCSADDAGTIQRVIAIAMHVLQKGASDRKHQMTKRPEDGDWTQDVT